MKKSARKSVAARHAHTFAENANVRGTPRLGSPGALL